jgi:hypothetical protein
LLQVEGGVEPIVFGPYHRKHKRHNAAKQIRRRQQEDESLFWADIDGAGTLSVGTYTAGFFWLSSGPRSSILCKSQKSKAVSNKHLDFYFEDRIFLRIGISEIYRRGKG